METSKLAPRGAIRNYADGGLIGSLKTKLFGPKETMTEKYARQDAERAAKQQPAPKAEPAAAAPTKPTNEIANYASMNAMQQREKAAGMKKGGIVKNCETGGAIRGKGTGTSDEIPIMASNGEFMIKAKAVKKIGIEALEALNAIADGPDEKDSKAEAKREYGMGAMRKMAMGGEVDPLAPAVAPAIGTPSVAPAAPVANDPYSQRIALMNAQTSASSIVKDASQAQGVADVARLTAPPVAPAAEPQPTAVSSLSTLPAAGAVRPVKPKPIMMAQGGGTTEEQQRQLKLQGTLPQAFNASQQQLMGSQPAAAPAAPTGINSTPAPAPAAAPAPTAPRAAVPQVKSIPPADPNQAAQAAHQAAFSAAEALQRPTQPTQPGTEQSRQAAYLAANEKVNSLSSPSYFAQATPTSAAALAQAKMDATTALQNIYAKNAPAGALPTAATPAAPTGINSTPAPVSAPVARAAQVAATPGAPTADAPTSRGGMITAQDNNAAAVLAGRYGQTGGFGPSGSIRGGGGVSSMDTSQGYASDLRQLAEIEKTKAAQQESIQGQADYAAMKAGQMSRKDYQALLASNKADATAKRGQDIQAGALTAQQKLAQETFGLAKAKDGREAASATMDQAGKKQLQDLQTALVNAKTPAERVTIEDNLRALQGKYEKPAPAQKFTVLNRGTDEMGRNLGTYAVDAEGQEIVQRAPNVAAPPKAGETRGGYKFKGGNPADQNNWEKI